MPDTGNRRRKFRDKAKAKTLLPQHRKHLTLTWAQVWAWVWAQARTKERIMPILPLLLTPSLPPLLEATPHLTSLANSEKMVN
jgi:hypothetical protein